MRLRLQLNQNGDVPWDFSCGQSLHAGVMHTGAMQILIQVQMQTDAHQIRNSQFIFQDFQIIFQDLLIVI